MNLIIKRQLLVTFIPAMLMLIALISVLYQVSIPSITQDVTVIANISPLSGILSNLGIFLWCVAAAICFFAAMTLRNMKQTKIFWFLLSSALLSTYLMFDDAFLFHEVLAFRYFGINEKVVFVILGIVVLAYLMTFRQIILKTYYGVLLLALGFLSCSVVVDAILDPWLWRLGYWKYFIEDGAKWLGIASWCSYYVHTSYLFVIKAYALRNNENQLEQITELRS